MSDRHNTKARREQNLKEALREILIADIPEKGKGEWDEEAFEDWLLVQVNDELGDMKAEGLVTFHDDEDEFGWRKGGQKVESKKFESPCLSCGWRGINGCTNAIERYRECISSGFSLRVERKSDPVPCGAEAFTYKKGDPSTEPELKLEDENG